MDAYQRMEELGLTLPPPPPRGGLYKQAKRFNEKLIYISGCGPVINEPVQGKLGMEFTVDQGRRYARDAMRNVLAVLQAEIGDLNMIKSVVKVLTFVSSSDDFFSQPEVANGGTQLLYDLFGDMPARSAIGVNVLPGNIPVETEALFELKAD